MRALISLFAAALLFAAGCSKTDHTQDNPATPPADQSATPSTMPPAGPAAAERQHHAAAGRPDDASGPAAAARRSRNKQLSRTQASAVTLRR